LKYYLQLHLIVLIWGFTAILGKEISISAVELVFYRTLLAFVLLGVMIYFQKKSFLIGNQTILRVISIGGLVAAHWILFFAAARIANVSTCLIGMATTSLWTSIFEPILNRRKISKIEIFFGIIVIVGLGIIFFKETKVDYLLGLTMSVVSAMAGAVYSVLNGKLTHRYDSYIITFYEMLGAFLFTGAFIPFYTAFFLSENQSENFFPTLKDWFFIAILGWVCTVYAFSAGIKLLRHFSAFTVNLTLNLEPVYGILLAFLFYGKQEQMTTSFYVGGFLVLASVFAYPMSKYYLKT
jgi:drug/metabolite transporter (DMT)-like permease